MSFTDTSADPGGTLSSHARDFGDGNESTEVSPSHTSVAAGTNSVTETITDPVSKMTSCWTDQVAVGGTAGIPVANFSYTVNGLIVTFTDLSPDGAGMLYNRSWSGSATQVNKPIYS